VFDVWLNRNMVSVTYSGNIMKMVALTHGSQSPDAGFRSLRLRLLMSHWWD
jgi:predicted lipid carrier protein YhbT